MTIYFIQMFLIWAYGFFCNTHKSQRFKKRYILFSFFLIIVIAALRKYTVGTDLASHYAIRYTQISNYRWSDMLAASTLDQYGIGYCYFIKFLSLISTDVQFFIAVTSIIIYGSVAYFIYHHSTDVVMSTCLFVFFCLNYMFLTIIAQGLAIALVLIGYHFLTKPELKIKRYLIFVIMVLLASTIHTSALLCLIIILFEKLDFKRANIVPAVITSIAAFVTYDKLYALAVGILGSEKYANYITNVNESHASLNIQSFILFVLTVLPFVLGYITLVWRNSRKLHMQKKSATYVLAKSDCLLMYLGLMASVCRLLLFQMNIINRFSYYFMPYVLILLPRAVGEIKSSNNRKIIRSGIYVIYGLYFVWMTMKYAASFYGTVPYKFFWN